MFDFLIVLIVCRPDKRVVVELLTPFSHIHVPFAHLQPFRGSCLVHARKFGTGRDSTFPNASWQVDDRRNRVQSHIGHGGIIGGGGIETTIGKGDELSKGTVEWRQHGAKDCFGNQTPGEDDNNTYRAVRSVMAQPSC